ncbi:MAG: AtpZ/AtpI family protein [Candidatus Hydrogenedens sp.]
MFVFFGYFIGNKLDQYFQTNGILLAIFIILSILTGFIGFFITIFKNIK